jgi:cytochrome c biogenesis protein CcdA
MKKILTAVLLLFVAINIGMMAAKHWRHRGEISKNTEKENVAPEIGEKFIVYYFHPRERCDNCRNIEAYGKEAVEAGFEKELSAGAIEWHVVDFDKPANRHFDKDFKLGSIPSIVLVKMKDGQCLDAVVLPAIQAITSETKPEFIEFVQKEIRDFLPENRGAGCQPAAIAPDTDVSRPLGNQPHETPPRTFAWELLWAIWLGIFTAITPCTLVANVAAVSYIGRRVDSPQRIVATGMFYALGQTLAYTVLGFILVAGLLATNAVSSFLHRYMNELLGPLLMLTAMFLLGLVQVGISGPGVSERLQKRLDALGIWGAFFLGVIFALTFCPVSGGLFFFQLIPQSAYYNSRVLLPALYGLGNVLPVVFFAFLLAFSAQSVGKVFNRLTQIEQWLQWLTGGIFLAAGIFFCLRYIMDIL